MYGTVASSLLYGLPDRFLRLPAMRGRFIRLQARGLIAQGGAARIDCRNLRRRPVDQCKNRGTAGRERELNQPSLRCRISIVPLKLWRHDLGREDSPLHGVIDGYRAPACKFGDHFKGSLGLAHLMLGQRNPQAVAPDQFRRRLRAFLADETP
ncbi:MAG: hypothetical protein ABFD92_01550 [Planctomycetaceae bacterium]|nr:hypothetical protein [Planctomycetaceae bacterium]